MVELICYLVAAVLFALAGFNVPARFNLMAFGLFAMVLPLLAASVQSVS